MKVRSQVIDYTVTFIAKSQSRHSFTSAIALFYLKNLKKYLLVLHFNFKFGRTV